MSDSWEAIGAKMKAVAGSTASYTALGSFFLYLFGYLTLRFHLTTFGVATDLAFLDERYLFAGAKFLVYLAASVPIVVMIGLVLIPLPYYLLRRTWLSRKLATWWNRPNSPALAGVVLAVLLIQFAMRECFEVSNVLLKQHLPGAGWLRSLLLDQTGGRQSLFFSGLVAGAALTAIMLYQAARRSTRFWAGLLGLLFVVQFLLLPVNFGVIIADKELPRLAAGDQETWLVWEGRETVTYLVRSGSQGAQLRKLMALPKKDALKLEIARYDPILRVLFGDPQ